ncbi:MAG TPA: 23S rRNA (guanosine(2251)-2'-O)-methyltransferase RlmB [Terriglobales bacterium]|nr:23S rRNA (guanosine(2251)-2'-O)-methyltransferase RlmB [Terriglobales bacterium]
MSVIYGINAVLEAIRARGEAIEYIAAARERHDGRIQRVVDAARAAGVAVRFLPREQVARLAGGEQHQGVAAVVAAKPYADLGELLAAPRGRHRFLVLLDGVEDPHNLGAVLRTADAAGADGVVIPERRAAGVNATVMKASAGAAAHVPVARVTNLNRALEELKRQNIWTVGLDERASQGYDELDYNMDCALVLGAEGHGLHEQLRKKCDFLVRIPMAGQVPSLNVSVAAGVVMYEVARQRRTKVPNAEDATRAKGAE